MKESVRVRSDILMRKSREGISKTEGTPNTTTCGMCDKPAIRNLKASDYYEYWGVATPEKYEGIYLCSLHTKQLNEHLEVTVNASRNIYEADTYLEEGVI